MHTDGLNDWCLPLTKHYSGDEIMEGEIGGGGRRKCTQDFTGESQGKR
jgi:hypothetical protein